jgi:hypothetical protein
MNYSISNGLRDKTVIFANCKVYRLMDLKAWSYYSTKPHSLFTAMRD